MRRASWGRFDRRADARHVHVDRAVEASSGLALDEIHEGFAREHRPAFSASATGSRTVAGEGALLPVHAHAARIAVDFKAPEAEGAAPALSIPASEIARRRASSSRG